MGDSLPLDRRSALLVCGVVIGLAIAASAWIWSLLEKPADAWSPQQAKALMAARDAVHAARGQGEEVQDDSPELRKAQSMVDRLEADLEIARNYRGKLAARIAAGGLALTVCSGLGYLATRGN